jgi:hypothetical protein
MTALLNGVWVGHTAFVYKRTEESYRAGVNRPYAIWGQVGCVNNAIYQVFESFKALSFNPLALPLQAVCYLTPVIAGFLTSRISFDSYPRMKRVILAIYNNISSVCQIAIMVSSVALICLGQALLGGATLFFIGFEIYQNHFKVSLLGNKTINGLGFILSNFARLTIGGLHHKILCVIDVGCFLSDLFSSYGSKKPITRVPDPNINVVNSELLTNLKIDSEHLKFRQELPTPPQVDLEQLERLFNQINWQEKEFQDLLQKKVKEDEHWKENFGDKKSDEELFSYVKKGVRLFINNISNRTLPNGESNDPEKLEVKARFILDALSRKDKKVKAQNIVELSIAAYYCPAGYMRAVKNAFLTVCDDRFEHESLPNKIYSSLDFERKHLFEQFLYELKRATDASIIRHLVDPEDIHNYNWFSNAIGGEFNFQAARDENEDPLSYISSIGKQLLSFVARPFIKKYIQKYNPELILDSLKRSIGNLFIKDSLLQEWFIDEYFQLNRTSNQSTEIQKRQARDWVYENVYIIETGMIKDQYLNYLLYKMGILTHS